MRKRKTLIKLRLQELENIREKRVKCAISKKSYLPLKIQERSFNSKDYLRHFHSKDML